MAAHAREGDRRVQVAEAPCLDREVGRLEQDREVGRPRELRALEEVGQRAELRRQLLLPEEEQRHVDRPGLASVRARGRARRRPRRHPSCRSRRSRARRRPRSGPARSPGRERCRSGRRAARAAPSGRRGRAKTNASSASYSGAKAVGTSERRCARTSASCRLSDGMSTSSSVRSARRCARGSTRRAYRHTLGITRRSDTPAGLEPEKGLLLAVLPKGADTEDELGELRELTRTALVEPVAELVQLRTGPIRRRTSARGSSRS